MIDHRGARREAWPTEVDAAEGRFATKTDAVATMKAALSVAPKGPLQISPGQRPGNLWDLGLRALKGRNIAAPVFRPFRATDDGRISGPGALPWAVLSRPLRGGIPGPGNPCQGLRKQGVFKRSGARSRGVGLSCPVAAPSGRNPRTGEGDIDAQSGLCISTPPATPSQGGKGCRRAEQKKRDWPRRPPPQKWCIFVRSAPIHPARNCRRARGGFGQFRLDHDP
jgi:hypothetical protein